MLNYTNARLKNLVVHFVGNKSANDEVVLSSEFTEIPKQYEPHLVTYLVSAFKNAPNNQFTHVSELTLNPVFNYCERIFEKPKQLIEQSQNIAKHLYDISTHSNIKEGEIIVSLVSDIYFDDEVMNGIAIVKSESKSKFFKTTRYSNGIDFVVEDGISSDKIDKGCLILNTNKENGYIVLVIDKTNSGEEAHFWTKSFLNIIPSNDSFHNTKNFLSLCKSFIKDELPDTERTEKIEYLNKSVSYFKSNESLVLDDFSKSVFEEPRIIKAFNQYREDNASKDLEDSFEISPLAVKQQSRVFKSVLKLDKNFHVYVHGNKEYIERGFDEDKGMKYYKLYYKEEE